MAGESSSWNATAPSTASSRPEKNAFLLNCVFVEDQLYIVDYGVPAAAPSFGGRLLRHPASALGFTCPRATLGWSACAVEHVSGTLEVRRFTQTQRIDRVLAHRRARSDP